MNSSEFSWGRWVAVALMLLACGGLPGAVTTEPNSSDTPFGPPTTRAPTPGPSAAPTDAATEPPSEAPFEWAGDWNMYHTTSDSTNSASFVQAGNTVSSTYTAGDPVYGETVTLTGAITADGMGVSGTWDNETFGTSGSFQWHFVPENGYQFVGSTVMVGFEGTQDWCGYRSGAPRPDPCLWP